MPKLKPYEYQTEAINEIWFALRMYKNVLLRAIMAAGKTVIATCLIEKFLKHPAGRNYRFLLLMDKIDLIGQFADAFAKFTDISVFDIGFACAEYSLDVNITKKITIASRQTFINRLLESDPYQLLIVDEVHGATSPTYQKIIGYLQQINPDMRLLGLTATPFNASGNIYGRKQIFSKIHHNITGEFLLNHDPPYLMEPHAKVHYDSSLENDLKCVGKVGDDYNNKQLSAVMSKGLHVQNVKYVIDKYCQDRKSIIVIAATIAHAEKIQTIMPDAEIVHSKMPKTEAARVKADFKSGKIRLVISVMMMSEGADYPLADCLILARPTKSVRLYLQIIGRIMRIATGKTDCLFIDLTPSTIQLQVDYDCVSIDRKTKKPTKKAERRKLCPMCDKICKNNAKICQECGYEFPEPEPQEIDENKKKVRLQDFMFGQGKWMRLSVDSVAYKLHYSKAGNLSVKVSHTCGMDVINKWVSPETQSERGRYYFKKWWRKRSETTPPKSVNEFLERQSELKSPVAIMIDKPDKYPEIKRSVF